MIHRLLKRTLLRILPRNRAGDRCFAFVSFLISHRRIPRKRPVFNDVLYALKTSDEILDPLRVFVSDKEFVKLYVRARIGETYNVPTLAILRNPDEVMAYEFPADCCIKPTHASGAVILRRNGAPLDRNVIQSWFQMNHYALGREENYRNLRPKIIVEPLIFDSLDIEDYKFFCYHGNVRLIQVDVDRHRQHTRKYFDHNWNEMTFSIHYPRSTIHFPKPGNLPEMLDVATRLSKDFSFVRIDMYSNGTSCCVGEITHCHGNVGERFLPPEAEFWVSERLFAPF
jgi:hypothetical protein